MKPIFEQELDFLKSYGVEIPKNCWRDGSKIYLNHNDPFPIMTFKIDALNNKINIKKNYIEKIEGNKVSINGKYKNKLYNKIWINKTLQEEIDEESVKLDKLQGESIKYIIACINNNPNHKLRISNSTGKDSAVAIDMFLKAMKILGRSDFNMDFFNTTNDVADTYIKMKQDIKDLVIFQLENELKRYPSDEEITIRYDEVYNSWCHNPQQGYYQWLSDKKKYFTPTVGVRNCCSTYKEGKLKEILDKKEEYILFLGMRKYESSKRAEYDWYLNEKMDKLYKNTKEPKYKLNVPRTWIRLLAIVNWTDSDIWLYTLREKLNYNKIYEKGFERAGCIICPMMNSYNDLLVRYWYKPMWNRWHNILEVNYDVYNRGQALKWTKEEYIEGEKWKTGESKIQGIITKKKTLERIKEVSEILNVSEEVAEKYFKNKCKCGKRLNPDEVAMFLKLMGRYEGEIDNRTYLCKDCLCKLLGMTKDEYKLKVQEFRNQGCNLF